MGALNREAGRAYRDAVILVLRAVPAIANRLANQFALNLDSER
jgi:hypothetical protein